MVDVATLGVRVDTSGLVSGKVALAELTKTGANTEKAMAQAGASVGKVGKAFSGNSGNVRMFAQQLSQVAQQGAATGQWAQALAIQAADIGLAFGVVGMAIGAAIPVVTAMAMGFLSSAGASKQFQEALESLGDIMDGVRETQEILSMSSGDMAKNFGRYSVEALDAARNLSEYRLADLNDALRDQAALAGVAASEMGNLVGWFGQVNYRKIAELADSFGISTQQAEALVRALNQVSEASTFDEQKAALSSLNSLMDSLGLSSAQLPPELRAALGQMEQLRIEIARGKSLAEAMERLNLSGPISVAADEASRLADNIQRAVNGMISLSAQGISSLRESELRLQYKSDPVGLAGAMAAEKFGDISGFDPILRDAMAGKRAEYIANAQQTERNRIALTEWQKQQAKAARGGSKRKGLSEAAREQQQALRKIEAALEGLRSPQEVFNAALAEADALMDSGALSMDKYTAYVDSLKLELQDAEFGDLIGDIESLSQSLADAIVNSGDLGEVFSRTLRKMASDVLASGIQSSLMGLFGLQQKKSSGSGLFGALFGNLLSFDGGGDTGGGPRSGGLDGKGGFLAMVHPNETVIDHTKGQGAGLSLQASQITLTDDGRIMATVRAEIGNASQQARSGAVRDTFKRMGSTKAGWGK